MFVACNHFSLSDPIHVLYSVPRQLAFLGKKELFGNKLFGGVLSAFGAVPIDREKAGIGSMRTCVNIVKEGKGLLVFPEGTRNKDDDELMPFKGGVSVMAHMAKAPILPVLIYCRPRKFHRNYIVIGKPICLDEYAGKPLKEEQIKEIDERLRNEMLALKEQVPQKFRERYERNREKIYAKYRKKEERKRLKKERKLLKKQKIEARKGKKEQD